MFGLGLELIDILVVEMGLSDIGSATDLTGLYGYSYVPFIDLLLVPSITGKLLTINSWTS